jgi:tetratricopeptide (TPR) repeat protein
MPTEPARRAAARARRTLACVLAAGALASGPAPAAAQRLDPRRDALEAFQRDDLPEAERILEQWLAAHPGDVGSHLFLGMMRITASQELARKDGDPAEIRTLAHAAIEPLLTAERLAAGRPLPDLHHALGYALMVDGHFEEAAGRYSRALDEKPGSAEILRQRGNCRLELGDFQGALDDLQLAIEGGSRELTTHLAYARALFLLGREAEAREALRSYHSLIAGEPADERHFRALTGVANYAMLANDLEGARGALEIACPIRPEDVACAAELGKVLFQLGQLDLAREALDRVASLETGPRTARAEVAHYRGMIAMGRGEMDAARRLFEESLDLAVRGETLQQYAAVLRRLGDPTAAEAALSRFGEVSELEATLSRLEDHLLTRPNDRDALARQIRVLIRLERWEEAATQLQRLRFTDPENPALPELERSLSRG